MTNVRVRKLSSVAVKRRGCYQKIIILTIKKFHFCDIAVMSSRLENPKMMKAERNVERRKYHAAVKSFYTTIQQAN